MSTADLRKIGNIALLDLDIISTFYGRDFLPYPFMFTLPSRFTWQDEYDEYARTVPDRFNDGDLNIFRQCAASYVGADIRVEYHVQYIPADTASVRVLAFRHDQAGFLAKQTSDDDVVDIYELSPYLLGQAVAEAAGLKKPGSQPAITIPEYAQSEIAIPDYIRATIGVPGHTRVSDVVRGSDDATIQHTIECAPDATEVSRAEVTAFGTVQTHWRPSRNWGIDPGKNSARWMRIKNDGDYLFTPDFSEAKPTTTPILAERIDRLITEDIKALRQFRNG